MNCFTKIIKLSENFKIIILISSRFINSTFGVSQGVVTSFTLSKQQTELAKIATSTRELSSVG